MSENFNLTLDHTATLANPTNLVAGMSFCVHITQGAAGPYVLSYDTLYKSAVGAGLQLTPVIGAKDTLACYYDGTILRCTVIRDFK